MEQFTTPSGAVYAGRNVVDDYVNGTSVDNGDYKYIDEGDTTVANSVPDSGDSDSTVGNFFSNVGDKITDWFWLTRNLKKVDWNEFQEGAKKVGSNLYGWINGDNALQKEERAMQMEKDLMDYQHKLNMEERSTAYQDSVSDALAAAEENGISPWALLSNFSPTSSGSVSHGSATTEDTDKGIKTLVSLIAAFLTKGLSASMTSAKRSANITKNFYSVKQ